MTINDIDILLNEEWVKPEFYEYLWRYGLATLFPLIGLGFLIFSLLYLNEITNKTCFFITSLLLFLISGAVMIFGKISYDKEEVEYTIGRQIQQNVYKILKNHNMDKQKALPEIEEFIGDYKYLNDNPK